MANAATISDTILGSAEELAHLHDLLLIKSKAAPDDAFAKSLSECAGYVARASDLIIADVVSELSKRQFPMTSKLKARGDARENPSELITQALRDFPAAKVDGIDRMLREVPERLGFIQHKLSHYMDNKDDDLSAMIAEQSSLLSYLISIAWLDA